MLTKLHVRRLRMSTIVRKNILYSKNMIEYKDTFEEPRA